MAQADRFQSFFDGSGVTFSEHSTEAAPGGRPVALLRNPDGPDLVGRAGLGEEIRFLETARGGSPVFVCYYTENTPYEDLANRLRESLDRFGLKHRIEPIPSRGSWVANTGLKAEFIERMWQEADGPICWVDADAELLRLPGFLQENPFDYAVVRRNGWYDISSFVYFGKTPAAGRLISDWARLCRDNHHIWDQVLLTLAWYRTAQTEQLSSLWLNDGIFRFPRPWLRDVRDRLFYYPSGRKIRPFVDQKQASRSLKSFVNASKPTEGELGSDDIGPAFRKALSGYDFGFQADAESIFR
jgi:hypothetical protein